MLVPTTREACMLTPIGKPLPRDLQDNGYHLLETLEGLPLGDQLNLGCRTLLAALVMFRPAAPVDPEQRTAFKTVCDEVQVWLKGEIAELRRPLRRTRKSTRKATRVQKVGHA
jgi:hypothetical protein